jgi:hypothetical protein
MRREGSSAKSSNCRDYCGSCSAINTDSPVDIVGSTATGSTDWVRSSRKPPAHGGQTLLMLRTRAVKNVIGAPPTVLRRSGFFGADNGHENSEQQQQKPLGDLLMTPNL